MRLIWYGLTFASVFTLNALHAAEVILAGKKKGAFKVNRECVQYSGYLASLKSSAGIYYTDLDGDELTFLADTLKALEEPNKVEFKDRIYNALVRGKLKIPIDWQRGYLRKFRFVPPVQRQFDNIIMLKTEVDGAVTPVTLQQFKTSALFRQWLAATAQSFVSSFYYDLSRHTPFLNKSNIVFLLKVLVAGISDDQVTDKASWEQLIVHVDHKLKVFSDYITPYRLKNLFKAAEFLQLPLYVRLVLMKLVKYNLHKEVLSQYKESFKEIVEQVAAKEKALSYPSIDDLLKQDVQKIQRCNKENCTINFSGTGAKSLSGLSRLIDPKYFLPSMKRVYFCFIFSNNRITYLEKEPFAIFNDSAHPMHGRLGIIDLQKNGMQLIEHDWDNNIGLRIADFSYNSLSIIEPRMFNSPLLFELRLTANHISTIRANSFKQLKELHWLFLDHNQLKTLEVQSLEGLHKLEILSLAHNNLSTLPIGWALSLTNLQMLNLKGNPLTSLPKGWHRGLDNLKRISIDHTNSELERRIKRDLPEVEIIYKEVGPQGWQL